ncbi:MAG: chemotaxis protein CheD [Desulfuromonadaceae bacterium]|nr:chemotaxis protein CheD [Desulfuromonadaceae bacterium]
MCSDIMVNKHFLFPGTIFAEPFEYQISTILGSCIAVCLWDKAANRSGMNHFMLPLWNGEGLATPKYGNIAMEKLLNKVISIGCHRENLVAKVFGGANLSGSGLEMYMIGDRNIMLAFQMLEEYRIPVVAKDVGGRVGRKIIMNTQTGVVLVGKGRAAAST